MDRSEPTILVAVDKRGVARITLNRPHRRNAFDAALIAELTRELQRLDADPAIRAVFLAGSGTNFCAGGDLAWMQQAALQDEAENLADARKLAALMRSLDTLSKPSVALVHGSAYGGGLGLVACCDIAIATEGARFCISEARLGLVPAVIGPYVIAAIGRRAARRYVLTADVFTTAEAQRSGLIHEVVAEDGLEAAAERVALSLLACGPGSQAAAKRLIAEIGSRPIDEDVIGLTARRIAEIRAAPEGREGVAAFLEKRKPSWVP
jgi:methylglutaconyl-CoA hydratase